MIFPGLIFLGMGLASCSYLPENLPENEGLRLEEQRNYITLTPESADSLSPTGLVFYPGAWVDPHAYMGWAGKFALLEPGHRVVIVKMPANLAVLGINSAEKILEKEKMSQWVIGGHSLGGAMACSMVDKQPSRFQGLVLMAAYPAESVDLSAWDGQVLSLTGSNDEVLNVENFESGKIRLPAHSSYHEIIGGNHAGFGSYGPQEGDGEAGITPKLQEQAIVDALANFFEQHGLD